MSYDLGIGSSDACSIGSGVDVAAVEVINPLESLHHEVELPVIIGPDVPEAFAMDFVGDYVTLTASIPNSVDLAALSTLPPSALPPPCTAQQHR